MARKKKNLYTAEQLASIKVKLGEHICWLESKVNESMEAFKTSREFDDAVEARDRSQMLVSAVLGYDNMDMYIKNAELSGEHKSLPFRPEEIDMLPESFN